MHLRAVVVASAVAAMVVTGTVGIGVGAAGSSKAATCRKAKPFEPGTLSLSYGNGSGGVDRDYNLSVPESYDGTTKVPVILSFHGLGESNDEHDAQTRFPNEATKRGYVVISPQALPVELPLNDDGSGVTIPFWNVTRVTDGGVYEQPGGLDAADDITFVRELVADLAKRSLCLDLDRVYVTGMSNGAGMAIQLACLFPNRYAAAAPVAGVNMSTDCPMKRPIPVLAVHGDADEFVDYTGGNVAGFALGNPGVEDRMAEIAKADGCEAEPVVDESADVTVRRWTGCTKGDDVELITIHGGPHTWPQPGSPVDASAAILSFFDSHGG